MVSSLALPKRLRIGLGDSLPLWLVVELELEFELEMVLLAMAVADDDPEQEEPNLCGKVLDFSQGRCFISGSNSGYNKETENNRKH